MNTRFTLLLAAFALFVGSACTSEAQNDGADGMAEMDHTAAHGEMPMRANDEARVSPNAVVGQTIGTTNVLITYGRPSVRGREIFGELEPYDAVWRAGANEATVFHVSGDVMIEGQPLAAGTYALFATPNENAWTLIFNSVAEQWGAYNRDPANDVLSVEVTPQMGPMMEMLAFAFSDVTATSATAALHWDDVMVPFTVSVAP